MLPASARLSPQDLLAQIRERSATWAQKAGADRVRLLMQRAERDLQQRLVDAEGLNGPGAGTFTATQLRVALEQVRHVLHPLKQSLGNTIVDLGVESAGQAAQGTIDYLNAADKAYRGINQPIAIDQARLLDRATAGAESTILNRIYSDPVDPRRKGVLDRYGDAVIGKFEEELQLRFVTQKPWVDVRQALIDQSPFLKNHPLYWAERIVRTEVMNANNRASAETIAGADEQLGDMVKILAATFDSRTAADSYAVHGQIRRPSEPFDTWTGSVMHPPARPNDREVVVPHRICWPLPPNLKPRGDGEVMARWAAEGRKGSPPARPPLTTVDLARFGVDKPPPVGERAGPSPGAPPEPSPGAPPPAPTPGPETPEDAPETPPAPLAPRRRATRQRAPKAVESGYDIPILPSIAPVRHEERTLLGLGGKVQVPVFPVKDYDRLAVNDLYALPAAGDQVKVEAWDLKAPRKKPKPYEKTLAATGKSMAELLAEHGEEFQMRNFDLERVRATKSTVDRRVVASYVAAPPADDPPVVIKHEGQLFLHHGHEELMAQRMKALGAPDRPVKFLDLDKVPPKTPAPVDPSAWAKDAWNAVIGASRSPKGAKKIREAFRDLVAGEGFPTREDRLANRWASAGLPGPATKARRMDQYAVVRDGAMGPGVLATHGWDGLVRMRASQHAKLDPGLNFIAKLPSLPKGKGLPSKLLEEMTEGVRTMVHETVHGASPALMKAYKGVGIGMEEAATEILARRTMRRLLGEDPNKRSGDVPFGLPERKASGDYDERGPYGGYIGRLLKTVEKHTGDDVHARLEDAVAKTRQWKKGQMYEKPEDAIRDFAHALGVKDDAKREALIQDLLDDKSGPFVK